MRREDHRVLALERVDRDADRRDVRAGYRNERRDDASRFGVLHEALFGILLDDSHTSLPQCISKNAEHFPAPAGFWNPHPAFLDAHPGEPRRRTLVCSGPRDRLAQPIDGTLIERFDRLHGRAGAVEQRMRELLFFWCECSWCHSSPVRESRAAPRRRIRPGFECASASPVRVPPPLQPSGPPPVQR